MRGPQLLIDGRNCAYRAIHANKDNRQHNLTVMLRFMASWISKHKPSAVHVFWDTPRNTVWRRKILAEYKNRESSKRNTNRNIPEELHKLQEAAVELFNVMNIRQYSRDKQEADDLIYAACRNLCPQETIIVSSDGDFAQIAYYMQNVKIWEPRLSKWVDTPPCNPAVKKSLMGDVSDCILGYEGIGDVKSTVMANDHIKLHNFLSESGRETFLRNMLLIDLSLSPHLLANQMYISRSMVKPITFDKQEIMRIVMNHCLSGVMQEYNRIILPFKSLDES